LQHKFLLDRGLCARRSADERLSTVETLEFWHVMNQKQQGKYCIQFDAWVGRRQPICEVQTQAMKKTYRNSNGISIGGITIWDPISKY
jgi:hypothetical protein